VIVCPRCSKDNQDHYKFCLGCGSELPREAAKKDFAPPTTDPPPQAAPAVAATAAAVPAAQAKNMQFAATAQGDAAKPQEAARAVAAAPAAQPSNCPACGNPVPPDFKFCGTCGHKLTPVAGAAAAAAQPAAGGGPAKGTLTLINPDGSEGDSFPLQGATTTIGRSSGGMFAPDAYLAPSQATFTFERDGCRVRDEDSLNGVYVRIDRDSPVRLEHGDVFRIGQEIVRFEAIAGGQQVDGVEPMGSPNPGYLGRICLVIGRDVSGNAFPIPPDGMHIGRERGDVIFPEDGYVSGLHCRLHHDGAGVVLTDIGSSNGTFVRVRGETKVQSGALLLMGQQLFRLSF
jgi:pSer/pThr/pTyr-binding forkhead associated (FHA) protein